MTKFYKTIVVLTCLTLTDLAKGQGSNPSTTKNQSDTKLQPGPTAGPQAVSTRAPWSKEPKLEIKCLNNDCNNGPAKPVPKTGAGLISSNMMTEKIPGQDVTSVPRKGVDSVDTATSVPKKGVDAEHHTLSAKKELKELAMATTSTPIVTSTTTTMPKVISTENVINQNKSTNLNTKTVNSTTQGRKPGVTKDEQDFMPHPPEGDQSPSVSTSLVVGLVFALTLMTVLLFVGLKRIESIRRRREYRRMNDFLIDGMYNDL